MPDIDDDLSNVTAPRLLALQATPAEAKPGGTTTLRALVATPEGIEAPPVDFRLCLARKPLTQLGAVNTACLAASPPADAARELGRGFELETQLPMDACRLFGPLQPSAEGGQLGGRPVDPDVTGGFYQPFVITLAGQHDVGAVRIDCDLARAARDQSIQYRKLYRPNQNPELAAVTSRTFGALDEAGTASVPAGSRLTLDANWNLCPETSSCGDGLCTANEEPSDCPEDCTTPVGCTGAESYVSYDVASQKLVPRREGIAVAWYSSLGHFENEQTGLDELETPAKSETSNTWQVGKLAGPATLWLVIRDTRGGQAWKTFHVDVTP